MSRMVDRLSARAEHWLCQLGLLPVETWETLLARDRRYVYAGDLRPDLAQYSDYVGMTPFRLSRRTINHDITARMPIPDGSIDRYQAEDVFEHLDYALVPGVLEDVFRVLKEGGLLRFSVPDYGFDLYRNRSVRDDGGAILFDPAGGGYYRDGKVGGGGHLWFPTMDLVQEALAQTSFASRGIVKTLHGYEPDGTPRLDPIDYSLGHVKRTPDHDPRGQNPYRPISIVVDAWKQT